MAKFNEKFVENFDLDNSELERNTYKFIRQSKYTRKKSEKAWKEFLEDKE